MDSPPFVLIPVSGQALAAGSEQMQNPRLAPGGSLVTSFNTNGGEPLNVASTFRVLCPLHDRPKTTALGECRRHLVESECPWAMASSRARILVVELYSQAVAVGLASHFRIST